MWLTEAPALTQSYVGLKNGLQICTELCRQYWQDLYPQADNGDMDERIGNGVPGCCNAWSPWPIHVR